jgi:hypothetical protein
VQAVVEAQELIVYSVTPIVKKPVQPVLKFGPEAQLTAVPLVLTVPVGTVELNMKLTRPGFAVPVLPHG